MDIDISNNPYVHTLAQQYQSRNESRDQFYLEKQVDQTVEETQTRNKALSNQMISGMHASIDIYA